MDGRTFALLHIPFYSSFSFSSPNANLAKDPSSFSVVSFSFWYASPFFFYSFFPFLHIMLIPSRAQLQVSSFDFEAKTVSLSLLPSQYTSHSYIKTALLSLVTLVSGFYIISLTLNTIYTVDVVCLMSYIPTAKARPTNHSSHMENTTWPVNFATPTRPPSFSSTILPDCTSRFQITTV